MFLEPAPATERRLRPMDTFRFSCTKDLTCFNSCCRNKHLPLPPYDIMRLKHALDLDSDDFLTRHAVYMLDPNSGFPIISLKMRDATGKICPFVGPDGCRVYKDRPMACRLFPLSRSSAKDRNGASLEAFFVQMETPGCLGVQGTRDLALAGWVEGQGLLPYIHMNDKMLDLLFHPKRDPKRPLDNGQLQKIMVACYNLDVFRRFVFDKAFLETYDVDEETQLEIKEDDTALLKLGFAYLIRSLFP